MVIMQSERPAAAIPEEEDWDDDEDWDEDYDDSDSSSVLDMELATKMKLASDGESWQSHLKRLADIMTAGYKVKFTVGAILEQVRFVTQEQNIWTLKSGMKQTMIQSVSAAKYAGFIDGKYFDRVFSSPCEIDSEK